MRKPRPRLQALLALSLTALSLLFQYLLLRRVFPPRCAQAHRAHAALLATLQALRSVDPTSAAASSQHGTLRRLSTLLLSRPSCLRPLSPSARRALEFSHLARPPSDAVLLYLLAVLGARTRTAVELHTRVDARLSAVLPARHAWQLAVLLETWPAYDASRRWYEEAAVPPAPPAPPVAVFEAGRVAQKGLAASLRAVAIAGQVDLLVLFADGGDDVAVVKRLDDEALRPRLLVLRFEDYWGGSARVTRTAWRDGKLGDRLRSEEGVAHDYAGASIQAWVQIAGQVGYRLVWCLGAEAIAFFVDARAGVGDGVLPTLTGEACIKARDTGVEWRRDMEAMWDEAQQYEWDRFR